MSMGARKWWGPVLLLLLLLLAGKPAAWGGEMQGVISYLEGEVTLDGRPAEIGAAVAPGSLLATGAGAYCEVRFADRNLLRLEPGTRVSVDPQAGVTLRQGALALVLYRLRAMLPRGRRFTVRTPVAVAGVRGTVFYVKVESPESTYLCGCNGSLHFQGIEGGRVRKVRAAHHQAFRFRRTPGGITSEEAGMLYHDDQGVDALAARIGVRIDWSRPGRADYPER